MKEITHKWGIREHEMFASNTLMKPFSKGKPANIREMTQDDVMKMQLKLKNDVKNLMYDAHKLPKEIVFLGRNMNLVRSINKSYGGIVNRVNVMAKYAVKGLS
jgi:aarF domain-containing kinase